MKPFKPASFLITQGATTSVLVTIMLAFVLSVFCVSHESDSDQLRWDPSMLQVQPPLPSNNTMEFLVARRKLEQLDWGCLFMTDKPGHSKNKWHAIDTNKSEALKDPDFFRGTTFWINEFMSVGHMMYDIALLQVLQMQKVDRIILQRAACISPNQCLGVGMFDSFFRGLYLSMIESYQKEIPIFFRWAWQQRNLKPMYLSSSNHLDEIELPIERRHMSFHLKSITCMERVIRNPMRCTSCFHNSVSPSAAAQFKKVAYQLAAKAAMDARIVTIDATSADNSPSIAYTTPYAPNAVDTSSSSSSSSSLVPYFPANKPVVVTLAHRGSSATRHIANLPFLITQLASILTPPTYEFRVVNTTSNTRKYPEQMRFVAESQVIIAEHGAFQSNLIYLRNGSLLIDMHGNYTNGENRNFKNLARMFGVYFASVLTPGLESHHDASFNITQQDCNSIADVVQTYVTQKPYQFNVQ